MNPWRTAVHLPTLRRALFKCDRLPADEVVRFFPAEGLSDWRGNPLGHFNVRVLAPSRTLPLEGFKPRRECRHRVQVQCPVCDAWIPAGRVRQHGKAHR